MKPYSSSEIKKSFIDFFKKKSHHFVPSSSLVPQGDKTILFSNSGMNQFKDIFLGFKKPEHLRVCNFQKCIRLSGKHNDLEEVGFDSYHHTFFEMLGNWSFGDYYKKEAIAWAWELLTEVWQLPKEKLFATVYYQDEEARKYWGEVTDIPKENILDFKEKDNFWEMAEVGPCGPCSEIHIDLGEGACPCQDEKRAKCQTHGGGVNQDCERYIEIWNLVFIQYNRDIDKKLTPLKEVHVDTGMGFERICRVLQNKKSNYDTDVFTPLLQGVESLTGINYSTTTSPNQVAFRVIVDHLRTIVFSIGDGVIPSNEGRGYVIRRVLRRAFRYGKVLGLNKPFLHSLVEAVVNNLKESYSELSGKSAFIKEVILREEKLFVITLDKGLILFEKLVHQAKKKQQTKLPGKEIFTLYDTYGFPLDLIKVLTKEKGLTFLEKEFEAELEKQRIRSTVKKTEVIDAILINDVSKTKYLGEEEIKNFSPLRKIIQGGNLLTDLEDTNLQEVYLVFDETCFYGEGGGQIGDQGRVYSEDKKVIFQVVDTIKIEDIHLLKGKLLQGKLVVGESYHQQIDNQKRNEIRKTHSATHLLQQALINHLGEHVQQAGSKVDDKKLRFDFNHYQKMTDEEIEKVEKEVNQEIIKRIPIAITYLNYQEAIGAGARAFFEEKYQDRVRVVTMGDYSKELCGGSHVNNTGEIGNFKIINETGIASGIRRIEAIVGSEANFNYLENISFLSKMRELMNANSNQALYEKIQNLQESLSKMEKHERGLKQKNYQQEIEKTKEKINEFYFYTKVFHKEDIKVIKNIINNCVEKDPLAIIFFLNLEKEKLIYSIALGEKAEVKYQANELLQEMNKITNGRGGGKKSYAQGGSILKEDPNTLIGEFKKFL